MEFSANQRALIQIANQNEAYKTKNDLVIWMRSNGYVPQTIFPQSKTSFDPVLKRRVLSKHISSSKIFILSTKILRNMLRITNPYVM